MHIHPLRDQALPAEAGHGFRPLRAVQHAGRSGVCSSEHLVLTLLIPVIPLGTKYLSTCTMCDTTVKLDKVDALQRMAASEQPSPQSPCLPIPPPDQLMQPPGAPPAPPEL